ncbi:MAG: HAD hydrolase family protein [Clostridium sp.]|nr:MAG: HAD hydrolase family protein [Clostridium sp.]
MLTLTAVMCSLGTDPIIYGFNRILSTIIGVLFALAVNLFHIPHHKNVNDLYVVGIDGIYSTDDKKVDGYINYTLNNLAYYKANICLFTTKTPTTLIPMLNNVKLNAPILCMSGAALYDTNNKKYLYEEKIKSDVANKIRNSLEEKGITPIVNLIDENVLYTYCECANNEMMKVYFDERRNSAYSCFVPHKAPYADVLYMVLIVKKMIELIIFNNDKKK